MSAAPKQPRQSGSKRRASGRAGSPRPSGATTGEGGGVDLGTDKLYFKIGEVAEIIGVAAHVLRYWETEFPSIKPIKSRSQQRVYRRKDVETLLKIKHLLYERKFTLAGARQELRQGAAKIESAKVSGVYKARQSLARVKEQLEQLAAVVRAEEPIPKLAADPSEFLRSSGGARRVLASTAEELGTAQPLLERPERERLEVDHGE